MVERANRKAGKTSESVAKRGCPGQVARAKRGSAAPRKAPRRTRQAAIAAMLDQSFGRMAESDPRLWDQRAFLLLVGIVYMRMADNKEEISTEELVTLAKILAESRRADAQADRRIASRAPESLTLGAGRLPESIANVVRQVYGVTVKSED